jgi:hypothetical protein
MTEECPLLKQDSRNDAVIALVMALTFRNSLASLIREIVMWLTL